MKTLLPARLLLAATALTLSTGLFAHPANPAAGVTLTGSPTRQQVKMERDEFLKTHRWDEASEEWMLKSGVEPPVGVKSRAEVKAERDSFLRTHRWEEPSGTWKTIGGEPRNLSGLSREQVKQDTARFLGTHRWDEQSESWVERAPLRPKG